MELLVVQHPCAMLIHSGKKAWIVDSGAMCYRRDSYIVMVISHCSRGIT